MICQGCNVWKKNRELEAENAQLKLELEWARERIFQLEAQSNSWGGGWPYTRRRGKSPGPDAGQR
jgi:hypothetical protein